MCTVGVPALQHVQTCSYTVGYRVYLSVPYIGLPFQRAPVLEAWSSVWQCWLGGTFRREPIRRHSLLRMDSRSCYRNGLVPMRGCFKCHPPPRPRLPLLHSVPIHFPNLVWCIQRTRMSQHAGACRLEPPGTRIMSHKPFYSHTASCVLL